ncbi:hypothetical protein QCA50_020682 [Cerrena zonata]|uniref:Uncharacterized protein n=1 Tax=Cerrena zonata TaxID=2478898 RepID=A0AAW0F933_9APHY
MIQACSKCQGLFIGPWSDWQRNCPTKNTTMFLKPIPARTMIPLWAYQDVLKTNFFNPATALLVSGKKVPNALLLSPKGRIAMIVLSSIGGFFALISATFSCWRICKRGQRSGVPSDSESPDTDGDDGEDKEQQQGLLDAGAPMGTTETAEVDKVPYTDTSFAPQFNDKNGESSSGYSPSVDHQGQGTYQPGLYWNTTQK